MSIESISWVLNGLIDSSGAQASLISDIEIKAEFGADESLNGYAGCNICNTSCEIEGGNIKIGLSATMRKIDQDPEGDPEKESSCLTALENVAVYKNLGLLKALWSDDGDPVSLYISGKDD